MLKAAVAAVSVADVEDLPFLHEFAIWVLVDVRDRDAASGVCKISEVINKEAPGVTADAGLAVIKEALKPEYRISERR